MNKILIFIVILRIIMFFLSLSLIYQNVKSNKFSAKDKKDLIIRNISDFIVALIFAEIVTALILYEQTENIFEKISCYLDKISYKIYKFLKKL